MRRLRQTILLSVVLLLLATSAVAQHAIRHVEVLASPEFGGRQTETEGEALAADYIASQLRRIGAQPLPGSEGFFHFFQRRDVIDDEGTRLRVYRGDPVGVPNYDWEGGQALRAVSFTSEAEVSGPIVFEDEAAPDQIAGAIVVVFDPRPEEVRFTSTLTEIPDDTLREFAQPLVEAGAVGILFVSDTWAIAPKRIWEDGRLGIPIASLSQKAGGELTFLSQMGALQGSFSTAIREYEVSARNVVGMLPPNVSPADGASSMVLIMGAHYDHIGSGLPNLSLAKAAPRRSLPHLGADDNASGCAAILAAGEYLSHRTRRSGVVLAFWSGEELGLLGSKQFTEEMPIPRTDIMAYMNFDMVGRLRNDRLFLNITQDESTWRRFVTTANKDLRLDVRKWNSNPWRSDGDSFRDIGIPVLDFFTGFHPEYHTPEDRVDTINAEGLDKVALLGARIASQIVNYRM
ncbi:M28 family peptidase [bacterium]|nr:M28 family peptidase [bacterium]